jgi:hypothetical protein
MRAKNRKRVSCSGLLHTGRVNYGGVRQVDCLRLEVENGRAGGTCSTHILKQTRTVTEKVVITVTLSHNDPTRAVADTNPCGISANIYSVLHCTTCKSHCDARDEEEDGFELIPIHERRPEFRYFHTFIPGFVEYEEKFTTYFICII